MQKHTTIIIGAGPGGLACATHLAKNGHDVLVLEKNKQVGAKVCAGGITHAGLIKLAPPELIERSFNRQCVSSNMQTTVIKAPVPIISTINRHKLGRHMLIKARKAGAKIKSGLAVTAINNDTVSTPAGDFAFTNLVGADGSNSMVRRHLGIPVTRTGMGVHYEVSGHFPEMEWHLDSKLFNNGYAWIFPHANLASVGVYGAHQYNKPAKLLKKLQQWAAKRGIKIDGLPPRAAVINFDFRGWYFNNIYLVGDAAGLASALTGEGIYPAVVSGLAVAKSIIDANYKSTSMARLIKKHRRHCQMVAITGKAPFLGRIFMESLILALRLGIIKFQALEMGD